MKYTTTSVTEAQIETIIDLLVNKNNMVTLEREDIMPVIEGKNCMMLEATQEEEDREKFFQLIRYEMNQMPELRDCQSMLVCFMEPEPYALSLDELGAFIDLMMNVSSGADVVWGTTSGKDTDRLKVIVVVA